MNISPEQNTSHLKNTPDTKFLSLLLGLLLIIATLFVYWQIKHHDFINFDDNEYITENQNVLQGITLKGLVWAFTEFHSNNWHPLTWLSHMMDVEMFGGDPGGHHLVNLFLHSINSLLLFYVLKLMTGSIWKSGFVAALFALHPLHVESVAWASERKDVLSAFFWMLTLWAYFRYVQCKNALRFMLVIIVFILGLLSKPMLVTLPFVLLLLDHWPLRRIQFKRQAIFKGDISRLLREKIPLFFLVSVSSVITYLAQSHGHVVKSLDQFPISARLSNALISYINYILKMFFPVRLAVLYPHPITYPWWEVLGAVCILIFITGFAIKSIEKYPFILTGWLWYLGTLIPVIGLVQVGMQSMANRYTYIPLIGLFIIVAWGVTDTLERFRYKKNLIFFLSLFVITAITLLTWKQIGYWKNSITLYTHAISVTTKNHIAHDLLGVHYYDMGKTDDAILHYSKALEIKPDYAISHNNMGGALYQKGLIDEAITSFQQAIKISPNYPNAHNNLGLALMQRGDAEGAIQHYLYALKIYPDDATTNYNLAIALESKGYFNESVKYYKNALNIKPDYTEAHNNLCVALLRDGQIEEAISCFKNAFQKYPTNRTTIQNYEKSMELQKKLKKGHL